MQLPRVIGHRSCRGLAPENTLAALTLAKQWALSCVEFDVRLLDSGEIVVFHDDTLERTSTGHGSVSAQSYHDLAQLDAGAWFAPGFQGEKIPLLSTYLEKISGYGLSANIEIKALSGQEEAIAKAVVTILEKYPALADKIILSSFSLPVLEWFAKHASHCPIALLLRELDPLWEKWCKHLHCQALHLSNNAITPAIAEAVKATSLQLAVYTINEIERAQTLWSWGVDAIFTDYPDRFAQWLKV